MENKMVLTISVNGQGQVGVNGPIHDKILCLGLIELAKVAILEYRGEKQILTPDAATVAGLGKSN